MTVAIASMPASRKRAELSVPTRITLAVAGEAVAVAVSLTSRIATPLAASDTSIAGLTYAPIAFASTVGAAVQTADCYSAVAEREEEGKKSERVSKNSLFHRDFFTGRRPENEDKNVSRIRNGFRFIGSPCTPPRRITRIYVFWGLSVERVFKEEDLERDRGEKSG